LARLDDVVCVKGILNVYWLRTRLRRTQNWGHICISFWDFTRSKPESKRLELGDWTSNHIWSSNV